MNPNIEQFRRVIKKQVQSDRPVIFVYLPDIYMSRMIKDFAQVLKP